MLRTLAWWRAVTAAVCAAATILARPSVPAAGQSRADGAHPSSAAPGVMLLDGDYLVEVRTRIQRGDDPQMKRALADLEREAKRALDMKPVSVMDKTISPPSGDKHDYMSQAPYWWPDPSKPNGRPYIRKDGERNPEINRLTDHDNLGRLTAAVHTLGLAYYLTGRADYAVQAARLVRVWFLDPSTR